LRKLHQKFRFAFLWHHLKEVPRHSSFVRHGDEVVCVTDTLRDATPDNIISLLLRLIFHKADMALVKIEYIDVVALNSERVAQFVAAARVKTMDKDFELLLVSGHRVDLRYKKQHEGENSYALHSNLSKQCF
jgi:hypothetical protein